MDGDHETSTTPEALAERVRSERREPIAIVGIGCRYPGAKDAAEFWELLTSERNAISEVPKERFDVDAYFDPRPSTPGKLSSRFGGFVDDIHGFDAGFFRISPREALRMDPQQRMLLEVSAEAIEDAFLSKEDLAGSACGVYVGCWYSDWESHEYADRKHTDVYSMAGSGRCLLSGRVSFAFDLRGPSLTVDTGCSASALAIHLGCQGLWLGDTELAVCAGVNAVLDPKQGISLSQGGMVAPDGQCKAFDASANGLVRSDGCGVVVLMRLSRALERGARVYALIRGSGCSNDGYSNGLLATPSEIGQELALRAAYRGTDLSPNDLQYVEAHGTGTRAGDPVELRALSALMRGRPRERPCLVGSVKTNIGHTEAASGVAGLIKTALAIHHRTIPASLLCETPTPLVDWNANRLQVATRTQPWPEGVARAGVSSFGISGTDVHLVLEEAPVALRGLPSPETETETDRAELLVLSAMSEPALHATVADYSHRLTQPGSLRDVCYSAALGRQHHDYRLAIVGRTLVEMIDALTAQLAAEPHRALSSGRAIGETPGLVFVFSGQGSQWAGMGRELWKTEPVFRDAIAECEDALRAYTGFSIVNELSGAHAPAVAQAIDQVQISLFAIQIALAALWRSFGVEPALVIGHSMGELAAAYVAGALSLDDASRIICRRSQLLLGLSGQGAMLAVDFGLEEAERLVESYRGAIGVAVNNGTSSSVLSGAPSLISELEESLQARKIFCRRLQVDVPGHSPQLDPLLPELRRALGTVVPNSKAQIQLFSTVTTAPAQPSELTTDYWLRNFREPVRFASAVQALIALGHTHFLEVSAHPMLLGAIRQLLAESGKPGMTVGSLVHDEPERAQLLGALGQLHTHGHRVNFRALFPSGRFVPLPSYRWQHDRYELLPSGGDPERLLAGAGTREAASLGAPLRPAQQPRSYYWESALDLERSSYLADHAVQGNVMIAGASFVDMALQAAGQVFGAARHVLEQVELETALVVRRDAATTLQLVLTLDRPGLATLRFYTPAADGAGFTLHASAKARVLQPAQEGAAEAIDPDAIKARCQPVSREAHYSAAAARGIGFGAAFSGVEELWVGEDETLARVRLPSSADWPNGAFVVHPALLDGCWQAFAAHVFANTAHDEHFLPVGVATVERFGAVPREVLAHARIVSALGDDAARADIRVCGLEGTVLLETRGLTLKRLAAPAPDLDRWLYELGWVERARLAAADGGGSLRGQTWLVLADRTRDVAARLAPQLEARGAKVVVSEVQPDASATLALVRTTAPLHGVIDCWALDAVRAETASAEELMHAQRLGAIGLTHVVQALSACGIERPRLWVITAGAQGLAPATPVELAQAPVWALARVLRYEFPEFSIHTLDLSPAPSELELQALVEELCLETTDDQIALRGDERHVQQLRRAKIEGAPRVRAPRPAPDAGPYRLCTDGPGVIDNLALRACQARPVGPHEVEIEVEAGGLNFVDVMKSLGIYPGMDASAIAFGDECCGVIRRLGAEVTGLHVGQRVVAMAELGRGCLARYVVTHAELAIPCPPHFDVRQAAVLPAVYLTAHYALEYLGRIKRGERVLIHSATGGVGLAAIQIARAAGAEIFATAGSPEKRDYLRQLGIEHVFDSRSLRFAGEIMEATRGQGVDVVLNSLAGEAIPASLQLLRDDGRFLEIGKRDIYENMQLGLSPFRRGLAFFHIDIGRLVRDRPEFMGAMLRALLARLERAELAPLPYQVFPASSAADGFRHMAQAKHIGKIAIDFQEPELGAHVLPEREPKIAREGASYLITGGLGGLGLVLSEWLVEQGARHLVLLGRNQPRARSRAEEVIARLRARGVEVRVFACDVSRAEELGAVFARVQAELPPLAGVIHAAAVLDDGVALQLNEARFERVLAPKLLGAFHLHQLTAQLPLDFFVLFSSAAATIGSPGQGNYASANEFMDALAHFRVARGLPALSVNWGPWRESGAAVRPDRVGRLELRGIGNMSDAEGLSILSRLLRSDRVQMAVAPAVDWHEWVRFYPRMQSVGLFEQVLLEAPSASAMDARERGSDVRAAVLAADPQEQRALLGQYLVQLVRQVMRIPASKPIDPALPLNRLGIDSLMAVELKNRMATDFDVALPVSKILLSTGLSELAGDVLTCLLAGAAVAAPAPASGSTFERVLRQVGDEPPGSGTLLDGLYDDDQRVSA
jgi:acyl transferase domain-containing protein/NADPH:quinone reductase-like Zn-dependent oxidoreductase/short-subunit dehydrogenase